MTQRPSRCLLAPLLVPTLAYVGACRPHFDREVHYVDWPVREIRIDSGNADLEVIGGARDEIRVEAFQWWTRHRPDIHTRVRNDVLYVDYDCWDGQALCSVSIEIIVPSNVDVTIDAEDGDILLSDIEGSIAIEGDESEVWGFRLRSPEVAVQTRRGDVTLHQQTTAELLSVTTHDGDIEASVPPGRYDLDVDSARGEVLVSPSIRDDPDAGQRIEMESEWGVIFLRATEGPRR